jgi:predicted dienelactone hydrolase
MIQYLSMIGLVAAPLPLGQGKASESTYKLSEGPHAVAVVANLTLHDAKRAKDLHIKIYYPKGLGRFPVVIFSHGLGGSKDGFAALSRFWAGHGYVTIHPSHADSIALRPDQPGAFQGLREELATPRAWEDRVRDVTFLIDSIPDLAKQVPALQGKLDAARIGVAGHSFGAYTTQLIAGATVDVPGGAKARSLADERARAFLAISPQGRGQQGLTERSWEGVKRPLMTMTGSRDRGAGGQGPDWKAEPFRFSPPGDKYHLFVEGAGHFTFGQTQPPIFDYIRMASIAFWDAYLKNGDKAKAYLWSDGLTVYGQGNVKFNSK